MRKRNRRVWYGLPVISLLLVNFLVAGLIVQADTTLQVVSVTPSNNSTDVPLGTCPTVVFNESVNPSTLTGSVNGLPIVPYQATFDALYQTLTIDLGDMEYDKTYTVVISGSLEDTSGNKMGDDYTFSFTTAAGMSKRPTSTIVIPADLQAGDTYILTGKATGYTWERDASNPLSLIHYDQHGVATGDVPMLHPTVLYFPDGIDGYKFYLIYTPYPPAHDENPCLMRSNDGTHFTDEGVINPLFIYNTQPPYDMDNLADPEAIKVGNTWMIFYEMEQLNYGHIGVAFSTDGVNYTPYGGAYSQLGTYVTYTAKYWGNPLTTIPQYSANGAVHPDVIYFPQGKDGYKYWMVYTPYPPDSEETPCIARSNDGITWTDSGITNPVIPIGAKGQWNEIDNVDPDFLYVPDYGKWFMVWTGARTCTYDSQLDASSGIALAYSSDGKNWVQYGGTSINGNADPVILSGEDAAGQSWERSVPEWGNLSKVVAPTLLYEGGTFYLYYSEDADGNNKARAGFASFTWNDATNNIENFARCPSNPTIDLPSDSVFKSGCGHLDISRNVQDNVYDMYVVRELADSSSFELALLTSTDKISWTNQGTALTISPSGQWDDQHIYRSCPVVNENGEIELFDGKVKIFYSGVGENGWRIGTATLEEGLPTLPFPADGNPIMHFSNDLAYEHDAYPNDEYPRLEEPAVIFKDNTYYMWYGSYNTGRYEEVVYATSSDPRGSWTKLGPVLSPAGHPDVVYDPERNLYVMLYLSQTNGQINIATSPDPSGPWTNHLGNPIFTAQGGWEGQSLYRSSLVEVGTQWYLYYSAGVALSGDKSSCMIGLAREVPGIRKAEISSNGGVSWTQLTVSADGSWSYPWTPPSDGIYSIQVRVTDDWMVGEPSRAIANVGQPTQPSNPILVVVNSASGSFGEYTGEILKAEGLNEFQMADIDQVTPSFLTGVDTVILTTMSLSTSQATMFNDYVFAGGNLIAFRPDSKLAAVFGLTPAGTTTSEGYLKVDATTDIGKGIVSDTIQFHGTADNYILNGASVIANLYSNSVTSTPYPAVATYAYGFGETVFFAYDLAKSTVYLRQGNPAQANEETDGVEGIRPEDLLAGGWLDVSKVPIPQADEQMRVLSNAIEILSYNKKPLPRLWYFPNNDKTMLIMTGDSDSSTKDQVNQELAAIQAKGGAFSFYMTEWMSQTDVQNWVDSGTDVGWHVGYPIGTSLPDSDYQAWYDTYTAFVNQFQATYGFSPTTIRNHALQWMGYADPAIIEAAHGIRMDFNYYHYGSWLNPGDGFRNGWITGSGIPMRFADQNGVIYDVYQADTNFPDETMSFFSSTGAQAAAVAASLFDLSNSGFYSAFVANFHPKSWTGEKGNYGLELLNYASSYGIPIWNGKQLLDFTDAKNRATFEDITYSAGQLAFILNLPVTADGLTIMIPREHDGRVISSIALNAVPQPFEIETVKGIEYAWFALPNAIGSIQITADYGGVAPDTTPPEISIVSPANGAVLPAGTSSVDIAIRTNENADCRYSLTNPSFDYFSEGTDFTSGQGTLQHSFTLSGLQNGETYDIYYKAKDSSGNINSVSTHQTFTVEAAPATWWNTAWLYTKPLVLSENSGSTLSDYEVSLVIDHVPSKMNPDFSDLRFVDGDQGTLLPYWIESYTPSVSATVWVRIPSIPASGTTTIFMYYGNPSATSASNGPATFEFFDDFNDGTIDLSKWVTSGVVNESDGYLQVGSSADSIARQNTVSYPLLSGPYALRERGLVSGSGSVYIGFANTAGTQFAFGPHGLYGYYTYDGTINRTAGTGQTSFATYDIVWTGSNVRYYQNGILTATHTNPPTVPMGAYLRAYTTTLYARCDWILIHKYASAEPSVVIGQEETATFTITVNPGLHGAIAPGTGSVNYGDTPTYVITPDIGYHIASITVNGSPVTVTNPAGQSYQFSPVSSDGSIDATFAIDTFTITVTQTNGGSIVPGTSLVDYGTTPSFTITPDVGYHIESITANDVPVTVTSPNGQIYQFDAICADGSLTATFAIDQFTITPSAGSGGSISPDTPQTVDYGSTPSFTVTAANGYHILDVKVDSVSVLDSLVDGVYTFPAVVASHSIDATFTQNEYSLTVTVDPSAAAGSVSADIPGPYHLNDVVTLTPTANPGYTFSGWTGDGVDGAGNTRVVTISGDMVVTAAFTQNTYTLTVTTVGSGSVSKVPDQTTYYYGDVVQLNATPVAGWSFSGWSGALTGSANPASLTINEDMTVTATFTQNSYTVVFTETGLPSGTQWSATLGGNTLSSTTPTITFNVLSGTYTWTVTNPISGGSKTRYFTATSSGTTSVTQQTSIFITYVTQYQVSFAVAPRGAGTTSPSGPNVWTTSGPIQISATANSGYIFNQWSTSTSSIAIDDAESATATATIGGPGTITANFVKVKYTVTFQESNLPSGTTWSATLNGVTQTSTTNTITFMIAAGTYSWSVSNQISGGTGTRYVTSTPSGRITVTGPTTIQIQYRTQYYLTMQVTPVGAGTTSPSSGWYNAGTIVTITANPKKGHTFVSWSGTGTGSYTGTSRTGSVVMNSPITEIATFT